MGLTQLHKFKPSISIERINGFVALLLSASIGLSLALFTTSNGRPTLITIVLYLCTFILLIANWRTNPNIRKGLMYCGIILVFSLVVGIFNSSYLNKYLFMTIMLLLTIIIFSAIKISSKAMNRISVIALMLLLFFFAQSFGYYDAYFANFTSSGDNTLNNPNGMGLILLFCFILLDRGKLISNNYLLRIMALSISVYGMYNYGSRSAIACLILYFAILAVTKLERENMRKAIFGIVVLIGLLLPMLYVTAYDSADSQGSSIQILGKDVYSGRQKIWSSIIQDEKQQSIMTGSQDTVLFESFPSKSAHSVYLDLGYKLGLPVLLLFLIIIYNCIIKNQQIPRKTYASIIIVLAYSFFESTLTAGNFNTMLMTLVFLNSEQDVKRSMGTS